MVGDGDNGVLDSVNIPEDAGGHKVAVGWVFDPEAKEFYPASKGLYSATPQLHRGNISAIDTIYPTVDEGVNCKGFKRCRFDIDVSGLGITVLRLSLLRWNSEAIKWFTDGASINLNDGEGFSTSGGQISIIEDEAFGAVIFLRVVEFVGNSFDMTVYSILC